MTPDGDDPPAGALPPVPDLVRAAYDPARFREDGHRLVDRLADALAAATARDDAPVLPWVEPAAACAAWPGAYADDGDGDLLGAVEPVIAGAIRLHHPRHMGHQVSPPLPGAALVDLVAALLNNGMAVYETGPTGTAAELAVVAWMARALGLGPGAGGMVTSGGSLGNLTALLAARQARAGYDAWSAGDHAGPPLAVLCSAQTHYSVARAVRMMGWGDGGAVTVDIDDAYRMRPDALPGALARARAAGRRVIAVVANAGATGVGAFDPLGEIATFCAAHGLWLHVDGAHGASAALSHRHRHLVAGIERADSVVWDAHKLLAMPALVTGVVFRDERHAVEAFTQDASYLYGAARGDAHAAEWFNLGLRTVECTKRMAAVMLHATLRAYGVATLRASVDRVFALGAALGARLDAAPDFELIVRPACNIVCWRWRPAAGPTAPAALDELQARVRRRVIERGRYYLVQTRLPVGVVMRCALMNPLAEAEDLDGLLDEIRAAGAEVLAA